MWVTVLLFCNVNLDNLHGLYFSVDKSFFMKKLYTALWVDKTGSVRVGSQCARFFNALAAPTTLGLLYLVVK